VFQFISSARAISAAQITAYTYWGVYLYKRGPVPTEQVKPVSPDPFVLYSASVWTARPGGLNPEGVKLIIAECCADIGRNVDILEAYQRDHFHLTYVPPGGYAIVPYGMILECTTQGLADGDSFNYMAKVGSIEDLLTYDYFQRQRGRGREF
jgi:hypothetical protein